MTTELRGKSAIVGTGHAGFGEAHGLTAYDVMAQSALAALGDAGLKLSDVDGLFCTMMEDSMPALMAAEYLGIQPRFIDGTMSGGSSFVNYLTSATMALDAGLCDVALIVYGSNQRTASGRLERSTCTAWCRSARSRKRSPTCSSRRRGSPTSRTEMVRRG